MSDLIDRQAAIDATSEIVFVEYEDGDPRKEESIILQTKAAIRDRIKALPPVQPTLMRAIGKLIGYTGNKCPNCGRLRVERYENGLEICEKCNWCEQTKSYWLNGV